MRAVAGGLIIAALCSAPLPAQEKDRSLERIGIALTRPAPIARTVAAGERLGPRKLGILTLVEPQKRGEIIRIAFPIGELMTRGFRSVAAANQRRQQASARRQVEAALEEFRKQQ